MVTQSETVRAGKTADPLTAGSEEDRRMAASTGRPLVEIAVLVLLVEVVMWVVPFAPNPRLAYACGASLIAFFLFACHIRGRAGARELGLRFDNVLVALKNLAIPLGAFVVLVLAIGFLFNSVRFGGKFLTMLLSVPLWALLQQYMLLAFLGRRLQLILGDGNRSILATAAVFSLLHLPNPVLVVACAAGGLFWAREYQRNPNLFANALTHTVASAFLANSLPGWLLKNMVVGYNYFLR